MTARLQGSLRKKEHRDLWMLAFVETHEQPKIALQRAVETLNEYIAHFGRDMSDDKRLYHVGDVDNFSTQIAYEPFKSVWVVTASARLVSFWREVPQEDTKEFAREKTEPLVVKRTTDDMVFSFA